MDFCIILRSLNKYRFGGYELYILDEPEAALSPILMPFPSAEIYELTESAIRPVRYQDTEHFRVTKRFLNAPEQMIRYLEIGE